MHRTRIKICGLTREDDVSQAVHAGADAIGFVLYPPSPRAVSPERAGELARLLGLQNTYPFSRYHGIDIGIAGTLEPPLPIPILIGRLIQALNMPPIRVLAHGHKAAPDFDPEESVT